MLAFFFSVGTVIAGTLLAALIFIVQRHDAPGPLRQDTLVQIPRGAGMDTVVSTLIDAGVLGDGGTPSDGAVFRLMTRLGGTAGSIKAGEYMFPPGISQRAALEKIVAGDVFVRKVTVAEGLTTAQVLALVRAADGLDGDITLDPAEGALLPETYHFQRGDSRDSLVQRMQAAMDETMAALWPRRDPSIPLTSPEDAIILASIVEKETGVPSERPDVASVFYNRLRRGMRLQSDPTVVYAATGGSGPLGRSIRRSDLNRDNPYNTYRYDGLPPGPIANPGLASLKAVLNPVMTPYLYFVADGTGGHVFAKTLAEHNRNVAKWRQIERRRKQGH